MIKKIKLSFLAIITAFFFSTPVVAEEHSYSISGNIGMMSDYVFRESLNQVQVLMVALT